MVSELKSQALAFLTCLSPHPPHFSPEDMIAKLERELADETTEKAYCDEQMAKTEEKKAELEADVAKMTSKIDQAAAKSTQLKEDLGGSTL